ncbi:alpha/beta hydrolase [Micromonospora sp. NPDC018662]|uniref:alpha/beta hydrolase n=1 Tax=Micromonospora sp. NPDC018662 TaxID=3364238 RepID=UPI0037BE11F3
MSVPVDVGPPPPFDPELAGPLREILRRRPSSMTPDMIPADRDRIRAGGLSDDAISRGGAFRVSRHRVPGPADAPPVPLLVCRPTTVAGPQPVVYTIHGGGMVAGTSNSVELIGELDRAQALGAAVVSVDYRLAPEHPDPAPVEDCYAGLRWVAEHAGREGFDAGRIVVSGASAGGGLAAGVALLARDRGGPRLAGQMLLCPMVDDRCDSASSVQFDGRGVWDRVSNLTGWTALLGERRGTGTASCYAVPSLATDLGGLPPAFVDVGSAEALRDEGVSYASRIWRAGGRAELHVWSGAFHSFDEWVPEAEVSRAARAARLSWLRRTLDAG